MVGAGLLTPASVGCPHSLVRAASLLGRGGEGEGGGRGLVYGRSTPFGNSVFSESSVYSDNSEYSVIFGIIEYLGYSKTIEYSDNSEYSIVFEYCVIAPCSSVRNSRH